MGFSKKNIDKDIVLRYLKNGESTSLIRGIKIDSLIDCDVVVMDSWASKFYSDLNPKERMVVETPDKEFRFINEEDTISLSSLSEAMIRLCSDNTIWGDIIFVSRKLNIEVNDSETLNGMKEKCINAIIKHFDK